MPNNRRQSGGFSVSPSSPLQSLGSYGRYPLLLAFGAAGFLLVSDCCLAT